jgi:hypothetical protein
VSRPPCPYGSCRYGCAPGSCRGLDDDAPPIVPFALVDDQHGADCLCPSCCGCACKAIGLRRLGFCRTHGRAFIPAGTNALERTLIERLAADAGVALVATADGGREGLPS